jgi:opacity protein-like surface antigen
MMSRLVCWLPIAAIAGAVSAGAQKPVSSPFTITAFAGAVIPIGDSSDDLNAGYTLGGAADFRSSPSTPVGVRAEVSYSSLGAKGLAGTGVSARATDFGGNLNLVLWFPMTAPSSFSPYITAGPSFSRLEGSASSGNTSISVTENHFGFNGGGGIDVAVGSMAVRIDARYKRISTDGSSFQTIPVTFGIRF